jgi:hypothetical protein
MATKTIRRTTTKTRKVDGEIVEQSTTVNRFKVPTWESRETDGGKRVVRWTRTRRFRNERGNMVRKTTRGRRIEDK